MTRGLRAGLVLAATLAAALPAYRGGAEPAALRPLALTYAAATEGWLAAAGVPVARAGTVLRHSSGFAIDVGVNCTAWIHLLLWLAGVAALALPPRRALALAAAGSLALAGLNLLRLALLFLVGARSEPAFLVLHPFAGELLLAGGWLLLWLRAARARPGAERSFVEPAPAHAA